LRAALPWNGRGPPLGAPTAHASRSIPKLLIVADTVEGADAPQRTSRSRNATTRRSYAARCS
jgi:hypothetical protein